MINEHDIARDITIAKPKHVSLLEEHIDNAPAQIVYRKMAYQPTDNPPNSVVWNYIDKTTGEVKQEGELCHFWVKSPA